MVPQLRLAEFVPPALVVAAVVVVVVPALQKQLPQAATAKPLPEHLNLERPRD